MTTTRSTSPARQAGLAAATLLAVVAGASTVGAQGAQAFDQGSFTISVGGQRAGREDFRIDATPGASGTEYVARATVVFGDRRLTPRLASDSAGVPSRYEIDTKGTTTGSERWSGTITRGRVSARINSARGESAREYVVTDGALIIDDDVFHQYFFLARRGGEGSVAIVIPRRNAQMLLRVSTAGNERLTIGTRDIDARHLVLTEPSGTTRDLWVDSAGRVLKVAIPSRNVVALRDDPPPAS